MHARAGILCSNRDTNQNAIVRYNFLDNPFMIKTEDLEAIGNRLRELRKMHNQLFVSQIELRINLAILSERQEELTAKGQYLRNICSFVRSEKI